jgi:hypothetical protein
MVFFPVFLSVVLVVRNQSSDVEKIVSEVGEHISSLVSDYELIVVDNSSNDETVSVLKRLCSEQGLPNLQIYALTKEADTDTASWVGLENALGDFMAVIDPRADDIKFLATMLEKSVKGADVVFANNENKIVQSFAYRNAYAFFNRLYRLFSGINLESDAPQYRVLSKQVVNFILRHNQPAISYRHLPATGGFPRANLHYSAAPKAPHKKRLGESIDRGMRLLTSTTSAPMRLVNTLCLFGASANAIYSIYVVVVTLFVPGVAPGWASLSLQQSGMFFLLSLVLLVLGEYILHMASLSNVGPLYHIAQEFTSVRIIRREKLNIEEVSSEKNKEESAMPSVGPDDGK